MKNKLKAVYKCKVKNLRAAISGSKKFFHNSLQGTKIAFSEKHKY
jgi:hypothetical protein